MGDTLENIVKKLKENDKKVQLIYGFNGMGKTRLSREFKNLIAQKRDADDEVKTTQPKVIYYNAFTEDLFYWDNDLTGDSERKLKIQPNAYTRWVLQEQGKEFNAIAHFQRYTSDKLTPKFSPDFSEVTFSFKRGNEDKSENVKISKGEESNFIVLDQYTREWPPVASYLTEGLPREIELRQKQYKYYRDQLLSFPKFPSSGGVPEGRGGL